MFLMCGGKGSAVRVTIYLRTRTSSVLRFSAARKIIQQENKRNLITVWVWIFNSG